MKDIMIASIIACTLIMYGLWIPANIIIGIGIRRIITLVGENVDFEKLLR
jgi:hypothetical protein